MIEQSTLYGWEVERVVYLAPPQPEHHVTLPLWALRYHGTLMDITRAMGIRCEGVEVVHRCAPSPVKGFTIRLRANRDLVLAALHAAGMGSVVLDGEWVETEVESLSDCGDGGQL